MELPTEITFRRSSIRKVLADGEAVRERRVRFVLVGLVARVFGGDGELLHEEAVTGGEQVSSRKLTLTMADGATWHVESMGCNCGG